MPHESAVRPAATRGAPTPPARDRVALARWQAHSRQLAAQQLFYLQAVEQFWRNAMRGSGLAHLRCVRCRQDELAPFFVQGFRLLRLVQDVPRGGHGGMADRLRAPGRVVGASRALPALPARPAGRARLMGAHLGAVASGAGSAMLRRAGLARGLGGGVASTCMPAQCGRSGCPRTMCVSVVMGSGGPEHFSDDAWMRRP